MRYLIYKITNNLNDKIYIGKTSLTLDKRFRQHVLESQRNRTKNRPIYKAMCKYGCENFTIMLIEEVTEASVNLRESYWINFYNTYKNGYNATKGGDGKAHIDYDSVLKIYIETGSARKVAELLNIDNGWTCKILKEHFNIDLKDNRSKSLSKSVLCITNNMKFSSIKEASQFLVKHMNLQCKPNDYASHISACCLGKRKTVFGHSFSYLD